MFSLIRVVGFALLSVWLAAPNARAQAVLPPEFDEEIFVSGLDKPTDLAFAPDGRVFVAEKNGRVRVVTSDGQLLPAPFVTMAVSADNDRGLMSVSVDPDFSANRYLYAFYVSQQIPTNPDNPKSRIARLVRYTANGNVAQPGSETILLDNIPSDADSHLGGGMDFGPDNKLYLALGDGATYELANPLAFRSQNLDETAGKVLRINTDGTAPNDNPFYTTPTATRSMVWQYGLRNPFKAIFKPDTGKFWISDVGWFDWEELNTGPAGSNFGWPCYEGSAPQPLYQQLFQEQCAGVVGRDPSWQYGHIPGEGGAITGGGWYTGTNYPPQYRDKYFITDYSQRWIRYLEFSATDSLVSVTDFATGFGGFRPVDVQQGPDGNLYYINLATDFTAATGSINRILYVGAGNHAPKPKLNAAPTAGYAPLLVQFDAAGSSDPDNDPLTYQWLFGDGQTASGFAVSHSYTANGSYLVTLRVSDGQVTKEAKTTITVGSLPPVARITDPPPYRTYEEGEIVNYSGGGSDADDGVLPASALVWTTIQHHNEHQHPYHDSIGPTGSFFAEGDHGAPGETIYYELVLTVTDSSGLQHRDTRYIYLNQPPTANAGPDQTASCVLPDQWIYLDGTGSIDPNNQPLTYRWDQTAGTSVTIVDRFSPVARFKPPRQTGGLLFFQLTVQDGHELDSDVMQVALVDLTDADGDGFPACGDCQPTNASQAPPGPTQNLRFNINKSAMNWQAVPDASAYDLSRGALGTGRFRYNHSCIAKGLTSPNTSDPTVPPSGEGFYYLSRATNSCGRGIFGTTSDGAGVPNPACP